MARRKRLTGIVAAASLLGAMLIAPLTATPAAAAVTIDRTSKTSVQNAYLNVLKPALAVPVGWTGNASTCTPGAQSAAAQAATFTAINYFRAMAGLPGVTESPAASTYAQAAAVMFDANDSLSHEPPTSWKCRTPQAVTGARQSNGSLGFRSGADAVARGWVDDAGVASLGHRKWVLYPATTTMGAGHTTQGGALKVFGEGVTQNGSFVPVAWPSSGYFPYEVLPAAGSWWSYAKPGVSMTNAQVSVTKNGAALSGVTIGIRDAATPNAMPHGAMPTVSWKMPTVAKPAAGATDVYHVKITGISPTVEYDVKVFSAEMTPFTGGAVSVSGAAAVGATLTATASGFSPAPASYTYQWLRNGAAISGATAKTYVVTVGDQGQKLSVRVTAAKPGYTSKTLTSATVVPRPRAMPDAKVAVSGSVFTGQTRTAKPSGFAPGSTLTYQWSVDGVTVGGATTAGYKLPQSAAGKKVTVTVTGAKPGYATTSVTSTFVAKDINEILTYQGHVQSIGWQGWVRGNQVAGTSGRSLRVEALRFRMTGEPVSGSIQASGHVQSLGWMTGVGEGQIVGTQGRSLRVEAFTIKLTGDMAKQYDVWYRTHAQQFGWLGWTRNGAQSGSAGYARRLEAVQVKILPAGSPAPGTTARAFHSR